jgi:ADP-ribosyl-[dinitrogen reductase] hydrolase
VHMELIERYRGSVLGMALGDALGMPVEFPDPDPEEPVRELLAAPHRGVAAGTWTDDTAMALCLAESLLERDGMVAEDQLRRYLTWYRDGHLSAEPECFGIGPTVRAELEKFEGTGDAEVAGDLKAQTNGALMRVAPVPLAYRRRPGAAIRAAGESSKTTHRAPASVDACRYFAGLVVGALAEVGKEELLDKAYTPERGAWERDRLTGAVVVVADGSFKEREPPEINGGNNVVNTLEAALWAFNRTSDFEDGCVQAVGLWLDSDTTGAVFGALAGAYYGEQGLPPRWLAKLRHKDLLTGFAEGLYELSRRMEFDDTGS